VPDIRTHHPELVRDLLEQAGFRCGVEPRVLEGRDPDWTCAVDGRDVSGDLYIHDAGSGGLQLTELLTWGGLAVLALVALLEAWAIVRLRRAAPPQPRR
jgi:hypothetical protein